jgi:hypothetical protein
VVGWITFPREKFAFVKGRPAEYSSSEGVIRTFCQRCGTSLTYTNARWPQTIDVTTGSTDNPQDFPPQEQVHVEDKLPWVQLESNEGIAKRGLKERILHEMSVVRRELKAVAADVARERFDWA